MEKIDYLVQRKKIKNMYARINSDGILVISAPYLLSSSKIACFALEAYNKLQKRMKKRINKTIFNEKGEIKILGKETHIDNLSELNGLLLVTLKKYLNNNYLNIAQMIGISEPPIVKIKRVKNYLGQYNKKNHCITLNLLIAHLDEELIEYVIIHELVHIRKLNHQKEFWEEVSRYCPYYKMYRKRTKKEFVYYENY